MAERSFVDTLKDIRHGDVIGELGAELSALVGAVRATGSKGVITLSITVKPASKGDVSALVLEDEIKVKPPKFPKGSTILFATEDNALQKQDPRQPELSGLRTVATVSNINRVESEAV